MSYRIGLIVGMEDDFPPEFLARINRTPGYSAELAKLGGIRERGEREYDVLVDRLSHEVPFYRFALKAAQLRGTYCINDPLWWAADDKFFGYSLAAQLGIAIPRTVLLPSRDYIPAINKDKSLRNLEYPLKWQEIIEYVGFPAVLKPADGGGWKNVFIVKNEEELLEAYNQTHTLAMTLQEFIDFDEYIRCICIGRETVLPIKYDPKHRCYVPKGKFLGDELEKRVLDDAYKINAALGYDMNSVEFAVRDGVPYAIDFTNPAPDMYKWSLGDPYFEIVTNEMVRFAMKAARERPARTARVSTPPSARHDYLFQHENAVVVPPYKIMGGDAPGRLATTEG